MSIRGAVSSEFSHSVSKDGKNMKVSAFITLLIIAGALSVAAAKPELCFLPMRNSKDKIMCDAYFPSYYYDSKSDECKFFVYGGCFGNANRFESIEKCERVCKYS